MYKILLVDDEKLELNAIANYIRWEDMGIVVAGTAKNGRDALQAMEACKPDIILTDVRMPIMNGLEFASKAKQLDKNVKIVFLSGHDEFQYIKTALAIEAMGYLLKPVDTTELTQLMQRVILKCQEDKQLSESSEATKEKLVRSLAAEQDEELRREWVKRIAMLPHPLPTIGRFRVCCCSLDAIDPGLSALETSAPAGPAALTGKQRQAILQLTEAKLTVMHLPSYVWAMDELRFCALSYVIDDAEDDGLPALMEELVEEAGNRFGVVMSVGISRLGRYLEELHERFGEAREANGDKFYSGTGRVIRYAARAPAAPESALHALDVAEQLNDAIAHLQTEQAEAVLGGYFGAFAANRTSRDAIIAGTMQLISEVERKFAPLLEARAEHRIEQRAEQRAEHQAGHRAGIGESPLGIDWKTITEPGSVEGLHAYLLAWCGGITAAIRDRDHDKNLNVVHQIAAMIHARYGEALTVDDLAANVYLTPNYIRTLFKQKTGETILEYMTKVRIERASELLNDRSLKIHEVARAAGYENVSYFCSLFQKHRGVTPNEYRKKYL